jgi:hypothetical protein
LLKKATAKAEKILPSAFAVAIYVRSIRKSLVVNLLFADTCFQIVLVFLHALRQRADLLRGRCLCFFPSLLHHRLDGFAS